MDQEAINQRLRKFYEFDDDDLAANRLGVFSEKQKKNWKEYGKDSKKSSIFVGLVFIGIGSVILFLLVGLPLLQGSGMDWFDVVNVIPSILVPLAFLFIGIGSLYGGIGSLYGGLRSNVKALKHSLQSVEGPVNIVEVGRATYYSPYRRETIYELRIGKKEFNAYSALADVVIQGDVYAVYFDSADDEIMSVEWISKG